MFAGQMLCQVLARAVGVEVNEFMTPFADCFCCWLVISNIIYIKYPTLMP